MTRRNLLLCFDAFGTLFSPKGSVVSQYALVARQCGIAGFTNDELETRLMAAIREERRLNPNYGKATGLGATRWWTNIIHKTFTPLLKSNETLPQALVPTLIHRFASDEGYDAAPGLVPALRALRRPNSLLGFDRIVVGVVTNSDDRVPSILSSLGLRVSPLRYGADDDVQQASSGNGNTQRGEYDVDFHCMSYDVGFEKPDVRIFHAADAMLSRVLAASDGGTAPAPAELQSWYRVYVGDEHAKDVVGSSNAGWHPVLLDGTGQDASMASLDDLPRQPLADVFEGHPAVRVSSIRALARWLAGPDAEATRGT